MKLIKTILLGATLPALCLTTSTTRAQAPLSIAGDAFGAVVTAGTPPVFPSSGYFLFLPADSGNGYQLIGVDGIQNSSGTYAYSPAGASGTISLVDNDLGPVNGSFSFANSSSGTFLIGIGTPYHESGAFQLAATHVPDSIAGQSCLLHVQNGAAPFAPSGTGLLTTAASGNSYTIAGMGGVGNSSGVYTYSKANASTGSLAMNDTKAGVATLYFSFSSATGGAYLATQPASGGFQVGTFTISNSVPAAFFSGQASLGNGDYYLMLPNGYPFGYYNLGGFPFPIFYHYDLGFLYFFDANDGQGGAFLYDFSSGSFWFSGPQFFPYVYDFSLNAWLYYYPDANRPGHYTTAPRYFYNFGANQIIMK